ncbi:MAG: carbon storage regulator [Planctomycetaceae bacterium]
MLVLSRKVGERVLIGDKIILTVVRIGPNAVRIGIEAPKDMNIVREEVELLGSVLGSLAGTGVEFVVNGGVELLGCGDCRDAHASCLAAEA